MPKKKIDLKKKNKLALFSRPRRPFFPPATHYWPMPPDPKRKGQFPEDILDHCKECPHIYCSGFSIAVTEFYSFYTCEEWKIQRKNKWAWILS